MRADTHDGPEQMLHVRGLIHCCSSHVRRSWNSVLQRTAGAYIMALHGAPGRLCVLPLLQVKLLHRLHGRRSQVDPKPTGGPISSWCTAHVPRSKTCYASSVILDPGDKDHETAGVHRASRRHRGSLMAACCASAADGDAGHRVPWSWVTR